MVTTRSRGGYTLTATPYGPSGNDVMDARRSLERGVLRKHLRGDRYRWLGFRMALERKGADFPADPQAFEATLYDYRSDVTLDVAGRLDELDRALVAPSARQPLPSPEEFVAAVDLLRVHRRYGSLLSGGNVVPYPPMPPLLPVGLGDGRSHRVVTVGLFAGRQRRRGRPVVPLGSRPHELVGVNLSTGDVFPAGPTAAEALAICGGPIDNTCGATGTTGQATLTVTAPDGSEVWRATVVRPRASSNRSGVGSGVELFNVYYRNRKVFFQANVPVLNVQYQEGTTSCGPAYRDWLNEEACFEAIGTDVTTGIRVCDQPPRTILESGSDSGNFRGAAAFFDGNDLLLMSEMQAGWYRYISSWRLRSNGTIEPRFGFSAVDNFCTCQLHVHHAYWRFDFDIEDLANNRIEEFNDPDVPSGSLLPDPLPEEEFAEAGWATMLYERSRFRSEARSRRWRVSNAGTSRHYVVEPGPEDGTADLFGSADAWLLRYRDGENGDGQGFTSSDVLARQRIDLYANAEPIDGQDIVFWYAAHLDHSSEAHAEGAYLGPALVSSWAEDITPPTTTTTTTTPTTSTSTSTSTTTTTTTPPTTTTTAGPGGGGGGGGGGGPGGGGGGGGGSGGGGGGGRP